MRKLGLGIALIISVFMTNLTIPSVVHAGAFKTILSASGKGIQTYCNQNKSKCNAIKKSR